MADRCLITGATGMVGARLAEMCRDRGMSVRAICRPTSDASHLEELGVEILRGDLGDPEIPQQAMSEVDYVFHCAAKVGDWGSVEEYRKINVEALRALLDVARQQSSLKCFVHLGSLGVYPATHHYQSDETAPLPESHMDGYTQTKLEAEKLVLQYHRDHRFPVVVLRPGFIYGPRDRTLFPPLIANLRSRLVRYIGSSKHAMNCVYVGNLVEAFFLVLNNEKAIGEVYNITDGEHVSKKRFIETVCNGFDLPYPRPVAPPLWLARLVAWWQEGRARRRGDPQPPRVTKARIKFMGLNLDFSIEKAKRDLGYEPVKTFDEAMKETIEWFKENSDLVQDQSKKLEKVAG